MISPIGSAPGTRRCVVRPLVHPRLFSAVRRTLQGAYLDTADVYRAPPPSGGKIGGPTRKYSGVALTIVPADGNEVSRLLEALPGLSGKRLLGLGLIQHGADIQPGDELRLTDGRKLTVEGVADWRVEIAVGLSEVRQ